MVAKVRLGRNFGASIRYVLEGRHSEEQKRVEKQAEVLDSNGIRQGSVEQITADFNRQRLLNPDLRVAVWHTALSFSSHDADRLTNELMVDIARQYLVEMNIDPARTQWLLVRHKDREHPHVHLLVNRIDQNGCTIDASFCQSRSRAVAISIAREKRMTLSIDQLTPDNSNTTETTRHKSQSTWLEAKRTIFKAVMREAVQAKSLAELTIRLTDYGIIVRHYPASAERVDEVRGITFEFKGISIKGSKLDRHCSWPKLKQKLNWQLDNSLLIKPKSISEQQLHVVSQSEAFQLNTPHKDIARPTVKLKKLRL